MRPISNDLRIRIVQMRQAGHSAADISALLRVCVRSVQRYYKAFLDTGSVDARKKGKPEGSRLDPHKTLISDWIKKSPSITLEEMCARLEQQKQLLVHHTTLLRVLRRWGFRYKKKRYSQRNRNALMSSSDVLNGESSWRRGAGINWSSSMKAGLIQRWLAYTVEV